MRQIAAIRRCDTSPRLYCCCDKALSLSLSLRYVARIQTSLNSCDRSQRQNSVAATMVFTCHTRRFVAAICRGDVSQRFVASCVSALMAASTLSLRPFRTYVWEMGTCISLPLIHRISIWFTVAVLCYSRGCLCSCRENKNGGWLMTAFHVAQD